MLSLVEEVRQSLSHRPVRYPTFSYSPTLVTMARMRILAMTCSNYPRRTPQRTPNGTRRNGVQARSPRALSSVYSGSMRWTIHSCDQPRRIDGFDQMRFESCIVGPVGRRNIPEGSQGDHSRVRPEHGLSKLLGETESVHSRHGEVEQAHVRAELLSNRQRRRPIMAGANIEPVQAKDIGRGIGRIDVVVNTQHLCWNGHWKDSEEVGG
jgi:hypothetical protein